MLKIRYTFIFLFIVMFLLTGFSQNTPLSEYITRFYTLQTGLPQNTVHTIVQQKNGLLQIGTENGVIDFDGLTFNELRLQDTYINTLYTDGHNGLWIGTNGDGLYFHPYGYPEPKKIKRIPEKLQITHIMAAGDTLLIGTERNGVFLLLNKKLLNLPDHIFKYRAKISCFKKQKHQLLIGTSSGIYVYNFENQKLHFIESTRNIYIRGFFEYKNRHYFSTSNGVYRLTNVYPASFERVWPAITGDISDLAVDDKNRLWLTTYGKGLYMTDGQTFFHTTNIENTDISYLLSILIDDNFNVWIGTSSHGLIQLRPRSIFPFTYQNQPFRESVRPLLESPDGTIWVGSRSGLYFAQNYALQKFTTHSNLDHSFILSLAHYKNSIYAGTYRSGLFRITPNSAKRVPNSYFLNSEIILALFSDSHENLWIGTSNGDVLRYDGNNFNRIPYDVLKLDNKITHFAEDPNGKIWVCSFQSGISIWDGATFEHLNYLSSHLIYSVFFPEKNSAIICTGDQGIILKQGKQYMNINREDGLPGNIIYGGLSSPGGFIYLSSPDGIFKLEKKSLLKHHLVKGYLLTEKEGMLSRECNGGSQTSSLLTKQNDVVFSTIQGPVYLPERLVQPVLIHDVMFRNLVLNDSTMMLNDTLIIPDADNKLAIEYSLPHFLMPEKIEFRYKMVPFEKDWDYVYSRRTAYYKSLPPGEYTFKVQAKPAGREWIESGASMKIIVKPGFFQSWYFYFLLLICIILTFIGLHLLRVKHLESRSRKLSKLVKEQTKILEKEKALVESSLKEARQANELKTDLLHLVAHDMKNPLQGILTTGQLLQMQPCENNRHSEFAEIILKSTQRLLHLIQSLLESAKLEAGLAEMEWAPVNLTEIIQSVVEFYASQLKTKSQAIRTDFSAPLLINGDPNKLQNIFDNLISNAIKFSPIESTIYISGKSNSETVTIILEDEGPGFQNNDMDKLYQKFQKLSAKPTGGEFSTGLGLSLVKQLVELHHGDIKAENRTPNGARFILQFPAKK